MEVISSNAVANGSLRESNSATRIVDLRSDTVTKPTDAMRAAMAKADVDDDVLGSDPTADQLQHQVAKVMGKEAGLFIPSGTMGNLISVLVHCEVRGSEVILGSESHINVYEHGGISTIGHVHPQVVPNKEDGTMDLGKIEAAIRPAYELFYPTTRLICIENTQANCGGRCITAEYTDKLGELAKSYGVKVHIDGARIFNASTALGVPVDRLVSAADSVSVCLSKGLGAPVGSVIVGSQAFIAKAKRLRKTLGGGMRQVGVLCAAGLVALHDMVGRLKDDHYRCRILAEGLNGIDGLHVDLDAVHTNIVFVNITADSVPGAEELCEAMKHEGVLAIPMGRTRKQPASERYMGMRGSVLSIDVYKLLDAMNDLQTERACMNLSFPCLSHISKIVWPNSDLSHIIRSQRMISDTHWPVSRIICRVLCYSR